MWIAVCTTQDVPLNSGACVKLGKKQIALFKVSSENSWYALDNRCPHDGQTVLARGILGDSAGLPKVSCPLHKQSFCLEDGRHLGGQENWKLASYPVKIMNDQVYIDIPPDEGHHVEF